MQAPLKTAEGPDQLPPVTGKMYWEKDSPLRQVGRLRPLNILKFNPLAPTQAALFLFFNLN